jgi:hypothetical protein
MTTQAWLGVGVRGFAALKTCGGAILALSVVILLAIGFRWMLASNLPSQG